MCAVSPPLVIIPAPASNLTAAGLDQGDLVSNSARSASVQLLGSCKSQNPLAAQHLRASRKGAPKVRKTAFLRVICRESCRDISGRFLGRFRGRLGYSGRIGSRFGTRAGFSALAAGL